jgi:hypothetical protein
MAIAALAAVLMQQTAPAPSASALKASIRMSVVKSTDRAAASDGSQNPYGNFGPLIAQLLTPAGPVDIQYTIAGDESRADVKGRLATLPEGSIVLQRLGENSIRVLNPANKTWYEIPADQNLGVLLGAPDVTIEPAGDTARIAGQTATRFHFNATLRVPVPEGAALPPDFPHELQLSGDLWSTDAFSGKGYAAIFRTLQAFAAIPGVEALTSGNRFPLRIALRSNMMPGYEIRSEVTSIGPAVADPAWFTVPPDYQKVRPPMGGG